MKQHITERKRAILLVVSKISYCFFVLLLLGVSIWVWRSEPRHKTINDQKNGTVWFGDGWYYADEKGMPDLDKPVNYIFQSYLKLKATQGKASIVKKIDFDVKSNEFFVFRVRTDNFQLYINDEFWYGEQFEKNKKASPIYTMHQLDANKLKKNDYLRIDLEMADCDYFIFQYPSIGDRYGILLYILNATKTSWAICLVAIVLLILNVIASHSPLLVETGRNQFSMKWLNSFLIASIVYVSTDAGWMPLFLGKNVALSWLSGISLIMIPMPFLMYTQCAFFPGHKRFEIIAAINAIVALVSIMSFVLFSYNLSHFFIFVHLLIGAGIFCGVVSSIQEKEIPPIEVIIGYLAIIFTAVLSIYTYWKGVLYPFSTFFGYGLIIYCMFMLIWFVRSSNDIRKTREEVNLAFMEREKQEAEEANEQKSRFLSHMSHEIRTPLNAVLGMNELIMNETDDTTILKYARNIENSGHTLLALINDVLDFSKIENGKMSIVRSDYSLSLILHDTILMVKERAESKKIDLQIDVETDIPDLLHGDEIRIKQIIINFLTNAIKYTSSGFVKLKVYKDKSLKLEKGDTIQLHIEVADSGMGIKKEELPLVFKEFECLDKKKNRSIEGTGLGLSITSRLVKLMNGTISVESEYGKGSIFKVVIPQKVVALQPVGNLRDRLKRFDSENIKNKEEHQSYPGKRVFVIDDNEINLEVIDALLTMMELEVSKADSGEKAITILERERFDMILTDDMMPGMDGTQLMQYIKTNDKGANENTPIVVITANAIVGAREEYIKRGFDEYISKPIDIDVLQNILSKYLKP